MGEFEGQSTRQRVIVLLLKLTPVRLFLAIARRGFEESYRLSGPAQLEDVFIGALVYPLALLDGETFQHEVGLSQSFYNSCHSTHISFK